MDRPPIVVFDLDGTLADTAGDLMGALNAVLAHDHIAPLPVDQARTLLGAGGRALIERGYTAVGRPLAKPRLEELFRLFLAHYEAHIADHSRLFPGVLDAMERLEARGFGLAVCTNKMEHAAKRLLAELGVADRFRAICGQDTFAVYKPDPGALLGTIGRADGDPKNVDHGGRFDHRYRHREGGRRSGDRGRLRLHGQARRSTRARPDHQPFRRSRRGGR